MGRASSSGLADLIIHLTQIPPLLVQSLPSRPRKSQTFITQCLCFVVLQGMFFPLMKQMAPSVLPFVYHILTHGSFICIYNEMLFFPASVQNLDSFFKKLHLSTWKHDWGSYFPSAFLINGEISPCTKATLFPYIVVKGYKTGT